MATAELAAERGAWSVAVTHVVERAGVSRRTFYDLFADGQECMSAAFEEALRLAWAGIAVAAQGPGGWAVRVRASMTALLRFLEEEPNFGRLLVGESLGGGPELLGRRQVVLASVTRLIDEGRTVAGACVSATPLTAEGVVGAVLAVLHNRLARHEREPLMALVNPLVSMVVLPYLGPDAARRELRCPIGDPARGRASSPNPLKDLKMRVTYRTLRVLGTVANHPGSSNRAVGDAAGLADQGQVSKLLARLERLGLIENANRGAPRGERNAWALTRRGRALHDSLTSHGTNT